MSGSHRTTSRRRSATVPGPRQPEGAVSSRSRGRRRKPPKRRGRVVLSGTAMLLAAVSGWFTVGPGRSFPDTAAAGAQDRALGEDQVVPMQAAEARTEPPAADRSDRTELTSIPGLGPSWTSKIPADTRQLVVATGKGKDSSDTSVTIWTKGADGRWQAGQAWAGHNARKGWTTDHHLDDLRSPIGLFSLTDAGGRKADPGSKLPYDQDANFVIGGRGFNNEPLAGSFDYVVAINYNRVPGRSPLDTTYPEGKAKGGGIWLHVDHGGPTHGCVSLPEGQMAELVRTLDPALKPMIVMGDAQSLAV
ncbi:L,D-transpeptidase family protein [Kitasatospora camelliae]|uniref:L,D-transpeptidase family protein n=1 Tax=Kitasatospora camelliae TaxID=3156397 RepID=A0AAU8JY48_9ACTN